MQPAQTFGRRGLATPAPAPAPRAPSYSPPRAEAAPRATPKPAADPNSNVAFLANLLFGFQGRLDRGAYRYCRIICYVVFGTVFYGVDATLLKEKADLGKALFLLLALFVILGLWLWTTLALQVKRWHDRDKSGAWAFVGLIPLIGSLWVMVELVFLEGTMGPNTFGPSPRGDPTTATVFET